MVQPSLTRRDDEPRCYRALKRTAKVKSRYAAGEMPSATRAEIWVKTRYSPRLQCCCSYSSKTIT